MIKPCRRQFLKQSLALAGLPAVWRDGAATAQATRAPRAVVAIGRCRSYSDADVRAALTSCFDLVGGVAPLVGGKTVTVKVNLTGHEFCAVHEPARRRDVHDALRDGAPAGRASLRRRRQARSHRRVHRTPDAARSDTRRGRLGSHRAGRTRHHGLREHAQQGERGQLRAPRGVARPHVLVVRGQSRLRRHRRHGVAGQVEAARDRGRHADDEEHVRHHAKLDVRRQGRRREFDWEAGAPSTTRAGTRISSCQG